MSIQPSMSIAVRLKHQKSREIPSNAESFSMKSGKFCNIFPIRPSFSSILTSFQHGAEKTDEANANLRRRREKNVDILFRWIRRERKKNFFVNSVMCGGAEGEFSYTIAIARGLCWCGWQRCLLPMAPREFSVDERNVGVQRRVKKKIESLNAHA